MAQAMPPQRGAFGSQLAQIANLAAQHPDAEQLGVGCTPICGYGDHQWRLAPAVLEERPLCGEPLLFLRSSFLRSVPRTQVWNQ